MVIFYPTSYIITYFIKCKTVKSTSKKYPDITESPSYLWHTSDIFAPSLKALYWYSTLLTLIKYLFMSWLLFLNDLLNSIGLLFSCSYFVKLLRSAFQWHPRLEKIFGYPEGEWCLPAQAYSQSYLKWRICVTSWEFSWGKDFLLFPDEKFYDYNFIIYLGLDPFES